MESLDGGGGDGGVGVVERPAEEEDDSGLQEVGEQRPRQTSVQKAQATVKADLRQCPELKTRGESGNDM